MVNSNHLGLSTADHGGILASLQRGISPLAEKSRGDGSCLQERRLCYSRFPWELSLSRLRRQAGPRSGPRAKLVTTRRERRPFTSAASQIKGIMGPGPACRSRGTEHAWPITVNRSRCTPADVGCRRMPPSKQRRREHEHRRSCSRPSIFMTAQSIAKTARRRPSARRTVYPPAAGSSDWSVHDAFSRKCLSRRSMNLLTFAGRWLR